MSSFHADAVAIQLIIMKTRKTYCLIYDLKNTNNQRMLEFSKFVETTHDCRMIFQTLANMYPPKIVKSVFLNINAAGESDHFPPLVKLINKAGKEFGYLNINWVTDLVSILTAKLFMYKIHVKKYEVDDCITIAMWANYNGRIYLLRKQQIGWDVLDFQRISRVDLTLEDVSGLFIQNGIQRHQIKDMFREKTSYFLSNDESHTHIYDSSEYLSRVFTGEDYFNDYDCFLGNICEERFYLKSDKFTISFPTEYKRLPFTIQKKLNLVKCNKIQLTTSIAIAIDDSFDISKEKVIYSESLKGLTGTVVVTLKVDENKDVYFKIEKNDAQKTLITTNVPLGEWTNDCRPTFTFGKNYVSVDYHKDCLSWKLRDANGAYQIPFKISFDEEVYIGTAAEEHPENLMPILDLEALSNVEDYHKLSTMFPDFILDDDKRYKILLKTKNGLRKARPENIVAVFIKSILKLLEEKLDNKVDEILVKYPNDSSTNFVISNACHFLKISHQNVTD